MDMQKPPRLWLTLWWLGSDQAEVRHDLVSKFEGLLAEAVGYGGGGFEAALCGESSGAY